MTSSRKGGRVPKRKDWMPTSRESLYVLSNLMNAYLNNTAARVRMGLGATTEQGKWIDLVFLVSRLAFANDYMLWQDPTKCTPALIQKIKWSEKVFKANLRTIYSGFLVKSPLVTDEDLVSMGLQARSGVKPTHVPVPETYPLLTITHSSYGVLGISFRDSESTGRGKPFGVHGIEILWGILASPPRTNADFTNSSFITRSPLKLNFEKTDCGKTIYMVARWKNTRAEKGPDTKYYSAVIS
jgi:hypothetical protein